MKLKSRSVGYTTMQTENHSAPDQTEDPKNSKENVEQLQAWLEHYTRQFSVSNERKACLEDLMRRKAAKKWSPDKTAKMVRRLLSASKEAEQAESAVDMITHRLSQAGVEPTA